MMKDRFQPDPTNAEHHAEVASSVYRELRAIAASYFRNESASHTLQPTALVHEAYVKLFKGINPGGASPWSSREHFLAVAATAMRQILVDHARAKSADKRGGGAQRFTIDEADGATVGPAIDVLELHEAIERLAAVDPQAAKVVIMRFFAGLTIAEVAHALGVSDFTVEQEWRTARAWLGKEMKPHQDS